MTMKRRLTASIAGVALLASLSGALAGGNWQTLPILGGSSYCASTVTGTGNLGGITGQGQGTTGSICGQTVPAGPPFLVGTEVIPMDRHTPGDNNMSGTPATIVMPITQFVTGGVAVVTTGTTYTVPVATRVVMLNLGAGTMAVTLPAAAIDGQEVRISNISTTAVTTFSVAAGSGQTLTQGAAPTSLAAQSATASASVLYIYNAAGATWYRA